ncbi:hypothetical protein [Lysinibacillus xylanilyticus]|uniref:hypothetical protein n=1 Tax=Lysinibacillus xylanilyticus TaxID=582475 RepID=UPI003D03E37C
MRYKLGDICQPNPHCYPNQPHHVHIQEDFCHKNQCSDNKKGLLTEFDFDEFNQNTNPSPSPGLTRLAKTDLCIEDKCDQVLLNAAINWQPTETVTAPLKLTETDNINFRGNIRVRFTIWRGNPSNSSNAIPICSFVDASPEVISFIQTIDIDPATAGFQPGLSIGTKFIPVTTDFKCVDENPICGKTEYFLTMNILDFVQTPFGATAATLTAMKIKKNDDNCC